MLADRTHPFLDKEKMKYNRQRVSETQKSRVLSGKHNFKNKVPVVDLQGNNYIISKPDYDLQKNKYSKVEDYPFVSTASKEAKRRKQKK